MKLLFGCGVTGVGLVDTEIPLVLAETGLVGFTFFTPNSISTFKTFIKNISTINDGTFKWLSLGFFSAIVGLIFQSVAVSTFIIIRIMPPFWLIAGLLSTVPLLETKKRSSTICSCTC